LIANADHMALQPGEVRQHGPRRIRQTPSSQRQDQVYLRRIDLDPDRPARRQQARGVLEDATHEIEPVGPAIQGKRRLWTKVLVPGDLLGPQVGQVREQQIDASRVPCSEIASDEANDLHEPEVLPVGGGVPEGRVADVARHNSPQFPGRSERCKR